MRERELYHFGPFLVTPLLAAMALACNGPDLADQDDALGASPAASNLTPDSKFRRSAEPVPNQYVVVLADDTDDVVATAVVQARTSGGEIGRTFHHALRGYVLRASESAARRLAEDPQVKYVEEDGLVHASATQAGATWGLDRIDQRALPLNGTYTYNTTGAGVNAYIIDTGIRITHTEFGGRAAYAYDAVGDGNGANDCNGHGTHVAGTLGGSSYGVAKGVRLFAVRGKGISNLPRRSHPSRKDRGKGRGSGDDERYLDDI